MARIGCIDELQAALRVERYFASRGLATSIFLALKLGRPLFLEGEAGVGKTEVAKVLADMLETQLIRLQCYEGLDVHHAVYEWNYTRQMMHIRLLEARGDRATEAELFGPEFLLRRPLQAIESSREKPAVLLIDEMSQKPTEPEDEMLPEYDFSGGVRGKYDERYKQGTNVVWLDEDIAKVFHDSAAVNSALRQYLAEHGGPSPKKQAG